MPEPGPFTRQKPPTDDDPILWIIIAVHFAIGVGFIGCIWSNL